MPDFRFSNYACPVNSRNFQLSFSCRKFVIDIVEQGQKLLQHSIKRTNWKARNLITDYRSSRPEVFCKKGVRNILKKESLAQMFSCEFYEISKSTFFYVTPPVVASVITNKRFYPFSPLI